MGSYAVSRSSVEIYAQSRGGLFCKSFFRTREKEDPFIDLIGEQLLEKLRCSLVEQGCSIVEDDETWFPCLVSSLGITYVITVSGAYIPNPKLSGLDGLVRDIGIALLAFLLGLNVEWGDVSTAKDMVGGVIAYQLWRELPLEATHFASDSL